jgi:histone H2A
MGINGAAMRELDEMVKTLIQQFTDAMNRLAVFNNHQTLSEPLVAAATKLLLSGQLSNHALNEISKAVKKYEEATSGNSRTEKAGLLLSVPRVEKIVMSYAVLKRKRKIMAVALAAVIEYLLVEILELAGNASKDFKVKRITPRHILLGIQGDAELDRVTKNMILPGGVDPYIHPFLQRRKSS